MSHAHYFAGTAEEGTKEALSYIERELGLPTTGNPDVAVMRYGLLSVEDARALSDFARQAPVGNAKAIVIVAGRLFHEAQNALLKLFEEPPEGTYLFLVVPTEGIVLPTLRSRMTPLTGSGEESTAAIIEEFFAAGPAGREKVIGKLLDRAKSDKEDEKQAARADAIALAEGLARAAYESSTKKASPDLSAFLTDLDRFIPILHERSAPLKQIFEHLLLVMPKGLVR